MSTSTQEKTGPSATVDLAGLKRFLDERKLGDTGALRSENISFGHSNEVHLIHFDGNSWALRRPPRGPLLPTAHDMMREYRVIKALQDTAVPVPRVYAVCDDPSYIGAPFYLMEYMRGDVVRADNKHFVQTPELRRQVSEQMVDVLVALQEVDWRAAGLEGFGRPDGYLERQLKRWTDQLERTIPHTRPLPVMEKVKEWLRARIPESPAPTIVHGDYKLDNVMFDPKTARAIAVLDWEMSTIGDPLADFGWMLTYWPDPTDRASGGRDRQHAGSRRMADAARNDRSIRAPHRPRDARLPVLPGVRAVQARDNHGGQLRAIRARTDRRSTVRRQQGASARAGRRGVVGVQLGIER